MTSRRACVGAWALAAAVSAGAAPAAADDMPARRAGLWVIAMQSGSAPAQTMRQCIDAKTDQQLQRFGQGMSLQHCAKNTFRREADRFVGESECRIGQSVAVTRTEFSGDFAKSYRGEVDARYTPPVAGMSQSRFTLTARWVGPCPAGWKPGDMEMGAMGRVNVNDLTAGRLPKAPK